MRRRAAIELIAGKEYLVERRLLPFVRQAGLDGVDECVNTFRKVAHSAELDRVVEALTVNETYWFRDVTPFQILTGHVTGMKRREQVFRNRNDDRTHRSPISVSVGRSVSGPVDSQRLTAALPIKPGLCGGNRG